MQIWRFKILSWSTGSSQRKSSRQLVDIWSCRIEGWEVMAGSVQDFPGKMKSVSSSSVLDVLVDLDSEFPPPMCSPNPQQLNFFKWESPLYMHAICCWDDFAVNNSILLPENSRNCQFERSCGLNLFMGYSSYSNSELDIGESNFVSMIQWFPKNANCWLKRLMLLFFLLSSFFSPSVGNQVWYGCLEQWVITLTKLAGGGWCKLLWIILCLGAIKSIEDKKTNGYVPIICSSFSFKQFLNYVK